MSVDSCKIIELPKLTDPRGNLSFIESNKHVPFEIKRVYYTYDIPGGETRGGHAHKKLQQLIIAVHGSFDIILDDGTRKRIVHLNRSNTGLFLTKMIWREITNFSSGSVCLALASEFYDEGDYYRDYNEFIKAVKSRKK